MVVFIIFSVFVILFVIPFLDGYTGKYKFAKYYGVKLNTDETNETNETSADIHKQERIDILDNTLVQYNKLLDNLADQLRDETDEKKRAAILAKQIIILEKYNKALEKREKLD